MTRTFWKVNFLRHGFASLFTLFSSMALASFDPLPAQHAVKASSSLLIDIEKLDNAYVAVGERGHVLRSEDNGKTWVQSDVPVRVMLNAVSFVDNDTGWAVGYDGHVVKTEDGGKTWVLKRNGLSAQAEANAKALQFYRQEVDRLTTLIASGTLTPEELLTAKDELDEADWQLGSAKDKTENAPIANPLLDVWFSDANNGWIVGAFGTLLKTTDGGASWQDVSQDLDNEMGYHLNAVMGLAEGSVVVTGEAGYLTYSKDGGSTWELADLGYDGTLFALSANPEGTAIVTTGLRGKTFISLGDLSQWTNISPDVGFSLAGVNFYENDQFLLVGHGGTLAHSNDLGESYSYKTLINRTSISTAVNTEEQAFILVGQGGIQHTSLKTEQK